MQRLLDDANTLNEAQGEHTDYQIENYSDIVNAIHDVQENMGIYKTTQLEASSTISGSVASMRSAWTNLTIGIADENADIDQLLDEFLQSAETTLDNLGPVITRAAKGLLHAIDDAMGEMAQEAADALQRGLEDGWQGIKDWFENAWHNLFANRSIRVQGRVEQGWVNGSHAGGLDYVPFDGYVAQLHKGERVLTREEASDYNTEGKSAGDTININISGANIQDPEALAEMISEKLEMAKERRGAVYA